MAQTPAFAIAQRARRKVEALFAELKNYIGLRRLRLRGMRFVREQFYLAATAQIAFSFSSAFYLASARISAICKARPMAILRRCSSGT